MLELEKTLSQQDSKLWGAYLQFHLGEYHKSIDIYNQLMRKPKYDKQLHIYKAVCLYALCKYEDAREEAFKGPESSLQYRLMYHIS